jgi:hypothetical protein
MEKNKTNYFFFFCGTSFFSLGPTQNVSQNVAFNMKKIWLIMFRNIQLFNNWMFVMPTT